MSFSFRPLLISAALLASLSGCGATVERRGGDPGEGDVDDFDGGAGEDDGEDDDGGPRVPDDTARSSVCPSSTFSGGAEDAIAVTWTVDAVDLILRDGRAVPLPLPTEAPPAGTSAWSSVVVGSGRIAVTRGWTTAFDGTGTAHATTRWFDRTGAQTDELVSDEGLWVAQLMPDGSTVMMRVASDWGYVARRTDGSLQDLRDFDVWGAPLPSGWLVGYDTTAQRAGFVNPATLERRLLDATSTYPALVEDGFVHLAGGASPALVHVTPDGSETVTLPALAGLVVEQMSVEPVAGSRWVLVSDWNTGARWRVDRESGDGVALHATPPAGRELLTDGCGLAQPHVTSSGDLVALLRTAGDGEGAVTPIGGGGWQTLGSPFAQPGTLDVRETAGTFVLTSGEGSYSYCPVVGWDEPASEDALPAGTAQLVRPSAGSVRVLDAVDAWSIQTTRDGGCATYTTGAATGEAVSRTLVDVVEGRAVALRGDALLWIE